MLNGSDGPGNRDPEGVEWLLLTDQPHSRDAKHVSLSTQGRSTSPTRLFFASIILSASISDRIDVSFRFLVLYGAKNRLVCSFRQVVCWTRLSLSTMSATQVNCMTSFGLIFVESIDNVPGSSGSSSLNSLSDVLQQMRMAGPP